jgi:hypothetical protein
MSTVADSCNNDQILQAAMRILRRDIEKISISTDEYPTANEVSLALSMNRMPLSNNHEHNIPRGYYRYQRNESDIENYQSVSVTSITLMLPINTIMSFLKVLTYFITSISSHPVVLSDSLLY